MSKASGGRISSKSQMDLEKCYEIKTASSELFIKLKNTISIYEHSLKYMIANHRLILIILLIIGDSVSTGYICIAKLNYPMARSLSYENLLPLFVGSIINNFSNATEV